MRKTNLMLLCLVAACGESQPSSNLADASVGGDGAVTSDGPTGDGPAAAGDPALDGTATVTTMTTSIAGATAGRTLPSTVFVPSTPGPHALVVVSPGFQMKRTQYASYAKHLATWGFVVVTTDYADQSFGADHTKLAQDVPAVITWALGQTALSVDTAKIAVAGHSLGGRISVFAATLDPRIKAVVGWDPVDATSPSVVPEKMTGLTAAIAVIGETTNSSGGVMPCAPGDENFQKFYAASPSPALSMTIAAADHMDWVDDPTCFLCTLCTAGTAPNERARTATRRLDVAWLRRQLFADTSMDTWLTSPPEVAAQTATVLRR